MWLECETDTGIVNLNISAAYGIQLSETVIEIHGDAEYFGVGDTVPKDGDFIRFESPEKASIAYGKMFKNIFKKDASMKLSGIDPEAKFNRI